MLTGLRPSSEWCRFPSVAWVLTLRIRAAGGTPLISHGRGGFSVCVVCELAVYASLLGALLQNGSVCCMAPAGRGDGRQASGRIPYRSGVWRLSSPLST